MIPKRRSILLLSSLLLLSLPAQAEDVEEAKRHFEKAEQAYKLGDFTVAIREYEASYKAWANPAFLFNIAQAHRQQYTLDRKPFHLHKALTLYKTYLREAPKPANAETVRQIITELKQIVSAVEDRAQGDAKKNKHGTLKIHGQAALGAKILLDGKSWGVVPRTGEVKPGVHQLELSKTGFKKWSTTIQVQGGAEIDIPVMLQPEGQATAAGSTPVYKKWWFWTIIAGSAAAVAGASVGIYYATASDDVPGYPQIDLRN